MTFFFLLAAVAAAIYGATSGSALALVAAGLPYLSDDAIFLQTGSAGVSVLPFRRPLHLDGDEARAPHRQARGRAGLVDVDRAVAAAKAAFEPWKALAARERGALLIKIADKIAATQKLTKAQAKAIVDSVFKEIAAAAASGAETNIPGFGKFKVKATPAREGRNPATGGTIKIAASKKLAFAPAKAVKDALNG